MRARSLNVKIGLGFVAASLLAGCQANETANTTTTIPAVAQKPTPDAARKALGEATERDRQKYAALSFDDFKKSKAVYKEPFAGGKYIVNGDSTLADEKQLRDFYEEKVLKAPPPPPLPGALIFSKSDGVDHVWNQDKKKKLAYCVSKADFGPRYDAVVKDMEAATGAWQAVAAVAYTHDAAQDAHCTASNDTVVFDVRAVDVGGQYLARAFFPNEPREARNVLVDQSALVLQPSGKLQLVGVLRHELGHTLGFRHEHTRPSSGACFEDNDWGILTAYDPYSVMHYPQCHGKGDWSLTLTARDKSGAACLYGAASGFTIDSTLVEMPNCKSDQPPVAGSPTVQSFEGQSVQKNAVKEYGPFAVAPGSLFEAVIGGPGATGDPDLYVRFKQKPDEDFWDCRPYLVGPSESCAIDVPADVTQLFVMVRGYEAGKYRLQVTRVAN